MIKISSPINLFLRNPLRVLNHIDLIERKLNIGKKWSLLWNSPQKWNDPKSFKVRNIVLDLQKSNIKAYDAARQIEEANLKKGDIFEDLLTCYHTGLLEFHPTDVCDLSCKECHYRNKENATIPFYKVNQLLKGLAPRAITVTGGGEPNVYMSESRNMNDLILQIKKALPNTELGLINNNTHIPSGNWTKHVAWQRTSIDACSRKTYFYLKGADKLDNAIENVKRLLYDTSIPFIGIGFLYRRENIREIESFLVSWFEWYKNEDKTIQQRFNIQFRPISPSIEKVETIRKEEETFLGEDIEKGVDEEIIKVQTFANRNVAFQTFLANNTNFHSMIRTKEGAISNSHFLHTPKNFNHCYNALIHRVLRANGDEYPDFLLCNCPELKLGNTIINKQDEEKVKIALMQFYYFNRECAYCNGEICRQGWVNQIIENHLYGTIAQEEIVSVPQNYFF